MRAAGCDGEFLIRSFGLGVYSIHLVGADRISPEAATHVSMENELDWVETMEDPEDPSVAYVVCGRGGEPCQMELDQFREVADSIERAAALASESARKRIKALQSLAASTPNGL